MIKSKFGWLLLLIYAFPILSLDSGNWLEKALERSDPEAILWVKEQLALGFESKKIDERGDSTPSLIDKKCFNSGGINFPDEQPPLYVMISFSVPESTWVDLSKSMESIGAVFVLSGLPDNSFKELSRRIQHLNRLGVKSPVQINPTLFTNHQIEVVPTFLIVKGGVRKLSGNVSLKYALEKMGGL